MDRPLYSRGPAVQKGAGGGGGIPKNKQVKNIKPYPTPH